MQMLSDPHIKERTRLIVNNIDATCLVSADELNEVFGSDAYAKVSSKPEELRDALLKKRLPGEGTAFREEIARIARRFAGLPSRDSSRRLGGFLSFTGRRPKGTRHRS